MSQPVLHLVQREPPSHRRGKPDRLNAVRRLHAVLAVVDGQRVETADLDEAQPLPLSHTAKPVLADFSVLIHAHDHTVRHANRDAERYTECMANNSNGGLALPPEMLTTVERYAVYRCYSDGGELLYVGITGRFGQRLGDHLQKAWFTQVRGMTFEWYADELDARNAERRAIHIERPKYNIQHRGAATLSPAVPRPQRQRKAAKQRRTPEERARDILAADPSVNGSELARRIGVSESYGRKIRRFVVDGTPISGRPASGERS